MTVRRLMIGLLLLAVGVPVGLGYWQSQQANAEARAAAQQFASLQTHTVTTGDVQQVVSGLGTMAAFESVSVGFRTGGQVEAIYVEVGDLVEAGDLLAELDNDINEIEHEQALLALDRAELALVDLIEPPTEDEIALAQANVDSARASYTAALTSVDPEQIESAELRYAQALNEYNALIEARPWRSGDENEIALVEAEIGAASFDTEVARLNLANTQSSGSNTALSIARVREAELNYEALFVGPTEYELEAAEINIERVYADLYDVERDDSRTRLFASISGEIGSLAMEVGEPVNGGSNVATIVNRDPLQLSAQIDENDINFITEGMRAFIKLDALPDVQFPAVVAEIALLGTEESGVVSYDVRFDLDVNDARVREGMTAEAFVVLDERADVVVVPNAYLLGVRGDQGQVQVYNPATATTETRTVTVGLQGQTNTEILAGLQPGELIALGGL